MEKTLRVDHKGGDLFEIAVRQHVLHVDQPTEDGGSDFAPTPTEMFVSSLASCVAWYTSMRAHFGDWTSMPSQQGPAMDRSRRAKRWYRTSRQQRMTRG